MHGDGERIKFHKNALKFHKRALNRKLQVSSYVIRNAIVDNDASALSILREKKRKEESELANYSFGGCYCEQTISNMKKKVQNLPPHSIRRLDRSLGNGKLRWRISIDDNDALLNNEIEMGLHRFESRSH